MSVGNSFGWMSGGDRADQSMNNESKKIIRTLERNKRIFNETYVEMPSFEGEVKLYEPSVTYRPILGPSLVTNWPKVAVNSKDAIIMAWTLISGGFKPVIIYNSCNTNRGGGAKEGATTVEAEICRRTNFWKALKKVSKSYPLKYGSILHAKKVNVFKSSKYALLDNSFDIDIVGLVFPQRPSKIIMSNDIEFYQNQNDRARVHTMFSDVFDMNYDSFIFCNIGLDQPVDEFINIMNQTMAISVAAKIFVTLPCGDIAGTNESEQRYNFIKYCTILDTKSPRPEDREDCAPPIKLQLEEEPHRHIRRKKMLRVMMSEKKGEKVVDDDDSDDCKSIVQLGSSDEE